MKNKFFLGLALASAGLALASCNVNSEASKPTGNQNGDGSKPPVENPLAGTYKTTIWVSEVKGVAELTTQQIKKFEAENPGIKIDATVEGTGEDKAATQMATDVAGGADIFCFAQDQLATLVRAKALSKLGTKASEIVQNSHETGSVAASTVDGNLMCYPFTADNGYFMYYDKRVVKAESIGSLEKIIADCEAAEKHISYNILGNTWYNAGFFFGTGCHSKWEVDPNGEFIGVDDNFNSENGLIALKGMQKVLKSPMFVDSADTADFEAAVPSAVVVSGTWGAKTAEKILGENLGTAPLPSYTVDGKTYPIGSFQGYKLMGVKPQTDSKKAAVCHKLAQFLTNEQSQVERYEAVAFGPSNIEALANEKVKTDKFLLALNKQRSNAVVQGQIKGNWWDFGKAYAQAAKDAKTDDELKEALNKYQLAMDGLFAMSEDEKLAWSVIGGFEDNGWTKDEPMVQRPAGTYYTKRPILFKAGDEFKLRQGAGWDIQAGADGCGKGNFTNIKSEVEGYFYVKMVMAEDQKSCEITLEKFNPNDSYSVIGAFEESNWKNDIYMEKISENEYLSGVITLAVGQKYKVRKASNWDINYGANNEFNGQNDFVCETAGKYRVKLVDNGNKKVEITLIPVK